jgi:hypothetical protein
MKENAQGRTGRENAGRLKDMLLGLAAVIPQARKIDAGLNIRQTPAAYDLGMYSEFDSMEDLNIYLKHPAHMAVLDLIAQVCEDRKAADWI